MEVDGRRGPAARSVSAVSAACVVLEVERGVPEHVHQLDEDPRPQDGGEAQAGAQHPPRGIGVRGEQHDAHARDRGHRGSHVERLPDGAARVLPLRVAPGLLRGQPAHGEPDPDRVDADEHHPADERAREQRREGELGLGGGHAQHAHQRCGQSAGTGTGEPVPIPEPEEAGLMGHAQIFAERGPLRSRRRGPRAKAARQATASAGRSRRPAPQTPLRAGGTPRRCPRRRGR